MVRAPCCEKMGLKKGPWTTQEDQILINYVRKYGHGNWRALPKQAGLLRCGKSCRLRWVNYLSPDIKRGNFDREEEEAIIELHKMLGNRWSAIAARLPGRTDNEIKNVWHTHLKKRVEQNRISNELKPPHQYSNSNTQTNAHELNKDQELKAKNNCNQVTVSQSPQHSSITETSTSSLGHDALKQDYVEVEGDFWSEVFGEENSVFTVVETNSQLQFQLSPVNVEEFFYDFNPSMVDGMDFWFNMFTSSEKVAVLSEL